MRVEISAFHPEVECVWCGKEQEGVTATFDDGFLRDARLCWRCMQQATRVKFTQNDEQGVESTPEDSQ